MRTKSPSRQNVIQGEFLKTEVMDRVARGMSVNLIAADLNVSTAVVKSQYRSVLAELAEERKALGELLLQDQLQRIEQALTYMEKEMKLGDSKAAEVYLKGLDQRARLLGMYPKDNGAGQGDVQIVLNFNGMPQSYRSSPTLSDGVTVEVVPEVVDAES